MALAENIALIGSHGIDTKSTKFLRGCSGHFLIPRTDPVYPAIPVQYWKSAFLAGKEFTCLFGHGYVTVKFIRPDVKKPVIRIDEFLPVLGSNPVQMADHPAGRLKVPVIGKTDKPVIGCNVREERELAAAGCPKFTLTIFRSTAGQ